MSIRGGFFYHVIDNKLSPLQFSCVVKLAKKQSVLILIIKYFINLIIICISSAAIVDVLQ